MKNNQKGGATLISTVIILLMLTVLSIGLLNMSRSNVQIAGGYQASEQAFNVAEAGLEMVARTQITSYFEAWRSLFFNEGDRTSLPDPQFSDYEALMNNSGFYALYYAQFPTFQGTIVVDDTDPTNPVIGQYYVRVVDNDNLGNTGEDEDGDPFDENYTANYGLDRDRNLFIQSRGIITVGGRIIASKFVSARCCAIEEASGSQRGESAANTDLTPEYCKQ